MFHYLSFQYSAIQKAILRHDRLWSISGISHILSEINEIEMRELTRDFGGLIILAGGGKFTVRFDNGDNAKKARVAIERLISTRLPMLEYQASSIVAADSLRGAREKNELDGKLYPGIIHELSENKRVFRGYGVTYNPHVLLCEECEEYPAERGLFAPDNKHICRICNEARQAARVDISDIKKREDIGLTGINRIYKRYMDQIITERIPEIPLNMEDFFPTEGEKDKSLRLAVWMSDVNSMGDIVPLWLMQDEDKVFDTFKSLKELFIDAISTSLVRVFPESEWIEKEDKEKKRKSVYIPFRLIVAGGDDLCIVMPDRYILSFVNTFSSEMDKKANDAVRYNKALTREWLEEKAKEANTGRKDGTQEIKGISFGGTFVVTPIHTPFARIHAIAEELMGEAKKKTDRTGNSINWRILAADEESQSEKILKAERPLLIEEPFNGYLSFNDYLTLCSKYKNISGSHLHQIVEKIIEFNNNADMLEKWLLRMPEAGKKDSVISKLLRDENLRDNDGRLNTKRLVTLFELLTLFEG
ncbi:MAG: hypothetical protein N3D15_01535 [Syntrophorhabdaceae bacterium]|nr:hypothetical protein [Syntrophorhabdaceae bacterium]